MTKKSFFVLLVLSLILAISSPALARDGVTISNLNVRTGPGTQYPAMTQISAQSNIIIEARNTVGDWIIIRSADDTVRGWVASRYVNFADNIALVNLPVSEEVIGANVEVVDTLIAPDAPNNVTTGEITGRMFVRVGPDINYIALGQLEPTTIVNVEGQYNSWVLINHNDLRGWVYSPFIKLNGVELANLPIIAGVEGQPTQSPITELEIIEVPLPSRDIAAMEARLRSIPVHHNMVNGTVNQIFARGRELGNNPRVFMKVGDSVTATQPFMSGFGRGDYNLGEAYADLEPTIEWFNVSIQSGAANSFVKDSLAAQSGFTSSAIFDGLWVNPAVCSSGRPLMCEYDLNKPSVAIVLLGSVDLRLSNAGLFQNNMHMATNELIKRGVIPVLTTFPNHPDVLGEDAIYFNNLILNTAEAYNVPVINLWLATQALPDAGINLADPIHMTQGDTYFHFDLGQENLYGVSLRNLMTLQALDILRINVLSQ